MSHFAIMVIGPNIEEQLAPYHEFECTGQNDQYVQDIDITDEIRAQTEGEDPVALTEALSDYGLENRIVASAEEVDKEGNDCAHKYGYAIVQDGKLIKAVKRSNPNKKWDWWQVGGRWSGFLKAKPGATMTGTGHPGVMGSHFAKGDDRVDQAMKKDIDWDGMRNEAGDRAAARWDKAAAATLPEGATEPLTWESWPSVLERHPGQSDEARRVYWSQPAIEAIKAAFGDEFFLQPDEFQTDRATYIQQARDRATVLYAVVMDGKWIAKGEMGWFGMSRDDVEQADWNRKVNELIDGLPDTVMITVCDCHI